MRQKNHVFYVAVIVLAIIVIVSLLSDYLVPYNPISTDLEQIKQAPSWLHLMGTDDRGRDILSRVMAGGKFSISIGILSTVCALTAGVLFGFIGGYFGGIPDSVLGFFTNITLAFPSLLLAVGLSSVMGAGYNSIFITLILIGWAGFAKLVRGETLKLKSNAHIDAAKVMGAGHMYILVRHIIPLCAGVIITAVTLRVGVAILMESSLSFLGLGVQPPQPTWGGMVSQGRDYFRSAPWLTLFPGGVITLTIICLNIIGETFQSRHKKRFNGNR